MVAILKQCADEADQWALSRLCQILFTCSLTSKLVCKYRLRPGNLSCYLKMSLILQFKTAIIQSFFLVTGERKNGWKSLYEEWTLTKKPFWISNLFYTSLWIWYFKWLSLWKKMTTEAGQWTWSWPCVHILRYIPNQFRNLSIAGWKKITHLHTHIYIQINIWTRDEFCRSEVMIGENSVKFWGIVILLTDGDNFLFF